MINPRTIVVSCPNPELTKKSLCFDTIIKQIEENRKNNNDAAIYYDSQVKLQQLNLQLCGNNANCAQSSEMNRYRSLFNEASANFQLATQYVTDADKMLGEVKALKTSELLKTEQAQEVQKDNTVKYILISIGVVVLIMVVIYFAGRKKSVK